MSTLNNTQLAKTAVKFIRQHRSLMMATLSRTPKDSTQQQSVTTPHVSHVPFALNADGRLLILVSELSTHTHNLLNDAQVSIMVVENEGLLIGTQTGDGTQKAKDPFARVRLTLDGTARAIEKNAQPYPLNLQHLRQRLGETVDILAQLPDFHLIELHCTNATFVRGFAQAHTIDQQALSEILQLAASQENAG